MAEEVTLLGFWCSPFAMRVMIALREKGVDFEIIEEDLSNKSPLLLQMNPVHKQIPVLIHKGRPVCESTIIVQYIDEIWSDRAPLLPSHPYGRARARFWADYVDKKIFNTGKIAWGTSGEVQEAAKKELIDSFKVLEAELGDKPYFGGEAFGLVDVSLIPFYSFFYAIQTCSDDMKVIDDCSKLVAWGKRCVERESVAKTLPDQVKMYTFLVELKKKLLLLHNHKV